MTLGIDVRVLVRGKTTGVEEYTRELVSTLVEITGRSGDRIALYYSGLRKAPLPGNWLRAPQVSIVGSRVPNRILNLTTLLANRPDIGRATGADAFLSPHLDIVGTGRVAHLITIHDLSFVRYPQFFNRGKRIWHNALQDYRRKTQNASGVVVPSEFTKGDVVEFLGIPEERVHVVYPGISPALQRVDSKDSELLAFRKRRGLEKPYLLYLGTLEPRKNIPAIVRAFGILKSQTGFQELTLVLAGRPGWLHRETVRAVVRSPYRGSIFLLGDIANEERKFLYTGAEVFVYPSFFEGFGFPPLEAQLCGCPVVTGNRSSLPETIEQSGALVDPWKVQGLAESIQKILRDRTHREQIVRDGFENVGRFEWEKAGWKILDIARTCQRNRA
jgi:glycosyltransferase involved in cell wall biosynthesis